MQPPPQPPAPWVKATAAGAADGRAEVDELRGPDEVVQLPERPGRRREELRPRREELEVHEGLAKF